jgi:nitrogen fixation/metabolism regulation signal transduction histidine kinase
VSPRRLLAIYLVAVHLLLAGALAFAAGAARGRWLLAELVVLLCAVVGARVFRRTAAISDGLEGAARLLEEKDLTSRLPDGQPGEVGRFVRAFNAAVAQMSEARVALEERTSFFEKALAASPAGFITLGFDQEIVDLNPAAARLVGVEAPAARGRRLSEIAGAVGASLAALPVGAPQVLALARQRRARVFKGEFLDRGFPRRFVLVEELTQELRQTERSAFEKVARLISHEVNNSLGASRSLLESCLAYAPQLAPDDRVDFEGAVRVVIGRTRQLGAFMDGIAEVVRVPPPRLHPTSVRALTESVAALLGPEAARRRIALSWAGEPDLPPVPLDRSQMEQVLVNLVKNALEAIGEGGRVTFRLACAGPRGTLVVEDTGGGVSAEAQAHLFSPFFTTKEKGQGIGLAVVGEILTQHGFDFALDAPPGGPTRFTIGFGEAARS